MTAPDRRQTPRPDHIDDRTVIEKYEDDCWAVARANVAARKGGAAMTDSVWSVWTSRGDDAPDDTDHDAFLLAMTDLLDVMRIDVLPPPINIGWSPARWDDDDRIVVPGGLQIQVDDKDAYQWKKSIAVPIHNQGYETPADADGPVVRVTGRLDGTRTAVTIYYVGRPS